MLTVEELLAPISPEAPSGHNLRYDPLWDEIREARRQDEELFWNRNSPPGALKQADYKKALRLAETALRERTKDLWIAGWYAECRVYLEGPAGLAPGLQLLKGLLEGFWESLYPEIDEEDGPEFRVAALESAARLMATALRRQPLTGGAGLDWYSVSKALQLRSADPAKWTEARMDGYASPEDLADALQATPTAFLDDWDAGLTAGAQALAQLEAAADDREAYDWTADALKTAISEVRGVVGTLRGERNSASKPNGSSSRGVFVLPGEPGTSDWLDAVRSLRQAEPASPVPYLLARAMVWGELRKLGSLASALDVPPSQELRDRLAQAGRKSEWGALLLEAEGALVAHAAWGDAQIYVCQAAGELGYTEVREAVTAEAAAFARRFPDWEKAKFSDGSPCFSMPLAPPDTSGRAVFLSRLELAKEALAPTGHPAVGRAILEDLVAEIERRGLEGWEAPAMLAEPVLLLYQNSSQATRDHLIRSLCRLLDPEKALALDTSRSFHG